MARVIDHLAGRLVAGDLGHLDAAGAGLAARAHRGGQLRAEPALRDLAEHDLLAAIRLAVGALGGLGVGEVLRRDVHPQALGREPARGDLESAEHAHAPPIAILRIWMRDAATCTAAAWSSALAAILADSLSTSTVEPSARMAPTDLSTAGVKPVRSRAER